VLLALLLAGESSRAMLASARLSCKRFPNHGSAIPLEPATTVSSHEEAESNVNIFQKKMPVVLLLCVLFYFLC